MSPSYIQSKTIDLGLKSDLSNVGGIVPTITLLCGLLALHISARDLGSYQNTPLKKFMIIMDYLQDEHTTWYILKSAYP